nr:unnamed protein product [Callosobruchus analis]
MSSQVAAQEHEVVGGPPPGGNYLFQEPIRLKVPYEATFEKDSMAYMASSASYAVVKEWAKRFRMGQEFLEDDERPGRSVDKVVLVEELVNPSAADPVTQQIQSKLGDFQRVRPFLSSTSDNGLIGVDGVPPSPGAGSCAPPSGSEFKKPHQQQQSQPHPLPPHHSHQPPRGGYVKPADGKPPYGGRGGYPGQPVKHGSGGAAAAAAHRANGMLQTAKGPPIPYGERGGGEGRYSRGGPVFEQNQSTSGSLREPQPSATPLADVDNIFKEMIVRTPLTAMAATPRIDLDNKYTFNPVLATVNINCL